MTKIIYDIAISIDGFICGENEDLSKFHFVGEHAEAYAARLKNYSVAIMGRKTYEIGYAFGMKPGDNPYAHMETFVFSKSLNLPAGAKVKVIADHFLENLQKIKNEKTGPIYLCGGGDFAGFLLDNDLIDELILKVNPILLSRGTSLFAGKKPSTSFQLAESKPYPNGVCLLRYLR